MAANRPKPHPLFTSSATSVILYVGSDVSVGIVKTNKHSTDERMNAAFAILKVDKC